VLNYSWREYGNRFGALRCLELFDALALPTAAILNTALYDHCPELIAAFVARVDELVGHGHTNADRQASFPVDAERALLALPMDLGKHGDAQSSGGDRLCLYAQLAPRRAGDAQGDERRQITFD
jgi:hypothetical protein